MKTTTFLITIAMMAFMASCGGQQPKTAAENNESSAVENNDSPDSKKPADILSVFKKVLTNEITHTDAESKRKILFKDYCDDQGVAETNMSFAIVDLDGDGIPEIVLEHDPGIVRVLHYQDGTVYGFTFDYRAMNNIKKDGTFDWSGGASHSGTGRQTFYETETNMVHVTDGRWSSDTEEEAGFYIYESRVTEQQFEAFSSVQWKKEEVEWKQFTTENVKNLKAWDDLEFFYSSIPDAMFPIPKRGGAVIPYDRFSSPQEGYMITSYGFESADWIESYKTQLRKAGFEEQECPDWMESLWRYDRSTDGATLIVELLREDNRFSINYMHQFF